MVEKQIDKGQIAFQTEGRLLQELGERLVASPQVALVELIKNSYDADATNCHVALDQDDALLVIRDDGAGMTFDQFSKRWMRIATSNKVEARSSPKFKRHLTGQKGIGRFAVRFLGQKLLLDSVAWDDVRKCNTRLLAEFDWPSLDKQENLDKAKIPYRLLRVASDIAHGTILTIQKLKVDAEFARSSDFRTSVLKIVSPLRGLGGGRFTDQRTKSGQDPGFRVSLPDDGNSTTEELDLAGKILDHAWAKLTINLTEDVLLYTVKFSDDYTQKLQLKVSSKIKNGMIADIRFFPRRAGVFRNTEVNGQEAWRWVRENCGVAVIDHGFRIPPYGLQENDWLFLDADGGHNERNWRSSIAEANFPIPTAVRHRGDNPMLNLPSNFQLVGAAFVQSTAVGSRTDSDLITSMDREGFLYNDAFEQFVDIVRGGIEFLAREDRAFTQREADRKAKEAARQTRADLRAAVDYIENSSSLTRADKTRLVEEYSGLAQKVGEVEEYDREARRKLETMSALGVVAGFMTHESARIVSSLKEAVTELQRLARKHPSLKTNLQQIEAGLRSLEAQLDYAKTFVNATQRGAAVKFKSAPQIKHILEKFGDFAADRGIEIEVDVDPEVEAPPMPITIYSGILLNLYTNALKAIMALKSKSKSPKIRFRALNEGRWHTLEVLDTGVGIPPNVRSRIWDPLFTTTSRLNNPLGSGMGLGLTLVRQLVEQVGGKIDLVDAPQNSTRASVFNFREFPGDEMKIILFEDDPRTAKRIITAVGKLLKKSDLVINFEPSDVRSIAEIPLYEDRLAADVKVSVYNGATLWVTDRDLSQTTDYRGLSEVTVSKVADKLGIPICKYAQGTTNSVFERQRDWGDAQIIIDRANIPEMARRIVMLARGFEDVSKTLKKLLSGSKKNLRTPAAVMASVLGRPGESDRIALYASGDQKMVSEILPFAAKPNKKTLAARLPSLFGYWLFDSILRFPGLLVNNVAGASYLNISVKDFEKPSVRALFADALYKGPFTEVDDPHWWRSDLDKIIDLAGASDGNEFVKKKLRKNVRPCLDKGKRAGWYCMVKKVPVSEDNSVGSISWFPPGADLARVRKDVFEEIGPWLGLY